MFRTPSELAKALGAGVDNKFTRAITQPTPLNFLADMVPNPCNHGLTLIALMALPAAADAVVELLTPSEHSILRGAVEPKLRRRFFRARKGITAEEKAADAAIKLDIPDTGLLIGNNLPGAQIFKNRIPGPIESAAWGLLDVAERAAWYILLGELAHDTAMRWTSAVYAVHKDACDKVPMPRNLATGNRSPVLNGNGDSANMWLETVQYSVDATTSQDTFTEFPYPFTGYTHYSGFIVNEYTEHMHVTLNLVGQKLGHPERRVQKGTATLAPGAAAAVSATHHWTDIDLAWAVYTGNNIYKYSIVEPLWTVMHDNLKKTIKIGG